MVLKHFIAFGELKLDDDNVKVVVYMLQSRLPYFSDR